MSALPPWTMDFSGKSSFPVISMTWMLTSTLFTNSVTCYYGKSDMTWGLHKPLTTHCQSAFTLSIFSHRYFYLHCYNCIFYVEPTAYHSYTVKRTEYAFRHQDFPLNVSLDCFLTLLKKSHHTHHSLVTPNHLYYYIIHHKWPLLAFTNECTQ